ncbi:hypothetical protein [Tateyamaria sp. syn59]|uniref:hypothetical protein n=1 Tax=Tateyamaria sp. syn59 TaxID=2576942 RepID=UPI001679BFCC|nr:hypothetical protein [Tateyamaria sp. syn59]
MSIVLTGAARRIEREQLFNDQLAYKTAELVMIGYHKPKKFPPFRKVASSKKRRKAKRQTWQQQKEIAMMFNAAFGGKVTE